MTKWKVIIDYEKADDQLDEMGSLASGVYGIDKSGIYHMFYHSKSYIIEFEEVEEIEDDDNEV